MEKKTIGGLIAALRKSEGMTQKDLARQLNVSDKTVSRWERDEGTPDLSLIPVIAELFQVTCDELLRGERKSPQERSAPLEENGPSSKGKKRQQWLLHIALSQYRTRTYISMGISVLGLIAALICNLAFLKAVLGFFCGSIFFVAGVVCQVICMNQAFLKVEEGELEEEDISFFRRRVIELTEKSIRVTVAFVGFTFPLVLMDAYMGLSAGSLLILGGISAAVFLLLYGVIWYFLKEWLLKKGIYLLQDRERLVYRHNRRLKGKCAAGLAGLVLVTFLCHQMATSIWGPWTVMEGTTFQDYDSFIEYMEQKIPYQGTQSFGREQAVPVPDQVEGGIWYDAQGNEITEEEARHRTIEDEAGEVVCEYTQWNDSVVSLQYTPKEGTALPITVYTQADLEKAEEKVAVRRVIFGAAYVLETAAVMLVYLRKRER